MALINEGARTPRVNQDFCKAQKSFELTIGHAQAYQHLEAASLDDDAVVDPDQMRVVQKSLLQSLMLAFSERFVLLLRQSDPDACMGVMTMTTMLGGQPLPVDTTIRLSAKFERVRPEDRGLTYVYAYDISSPYTSASYLRGTFDVLHTAN